MNALRLHPSDALRICASAAWIPPSAVIATDVSIRIAAERPP